MCQRYCFQRRLWKWRGLVVFQDGAEEEPIAFHRRRRRDAAMTLRGCAGRPWTPFIRLCAESHCWHDEVMRHPESPNGDIGGGGGRCACSSGAQSVAACVAWMKSPSGRAPLQVAGSGVVGCRSQESVYDTSLGVAAPPRKARCCRGPGSDGVGRRAVGALNLRVGLELIRCTHAQEIHHGALRFASPLGALLTAPS